MKQSWVVGIMVIYVILQGLTMIMQVDSVGDGSVWGVLHGLWYTNFAQLQGYSNSAIWAVASSVLAVFVSFGQAIILWYPAIFQGVYTWFWFCICLPIAVGFIVSIITIIRGVHTS